MDTVDVVFSRNFFGPDQVLRMRATPAGAPLVHTIPASWSLPPGTRLAEDVLRDDPPEADEGPRTLKEMQAASGKARKSPVEPKRE